MALSWGGLRELPASLTAAPAPAPARALLRAARAFAQPRVAIITLCVIVLAGFGLRAAQAADPGRYLSSDERSYARVAVSIADHGSYQPAGTRDPWHWAPGTPVLFAAAHLIAPGLDGDGSPQELRSAFWAQALVGTALIIAVYLLAAGIAGALAGLLAAGLIAFYPPLIRATGDLISEPLAALTLTLAMLALLAAWRAPSLRRLGLAGAALGVALLVRADLLVLPVVLGACWPLGARARAGGLRALGQGALLAAIPLLIVLPWSVAASAQAGRIVPIASSGPSTLFVGTYLPGDGRMSGVREELQLYVRRNITNLHDVRTANIPGAYVIRAYIRERHPEIIPAPHRAIPEDRLRAAIAFEARRNLKTYALHEPLAFLAMDARKAARMWAGPYTGRYGARSGWVRGWHLALVGLALAGALAGLLVVRRRRGELALLLVPILFGTLMSAIFVAQARHNLKVLPLLVAAGAAGAVLAARAVREHRRRVIVADPPGEQIVVRDRRPRPQVTSPAAR
ncbi:unannotated protein [freshwater metagenome]|uniref:Unannotated protein n=1 Tax=freshwater metagenome TaxID=449393 RepID=A0A6J7HPT3_9ZZZZ|nr:hypothetical protein [Actinomycetota bacterium]